MLEKRERKRKRFSIRFLSSTKTYRIWVDTIEVIVNINGKSILPFKTLSRRQIAYRCNFLLCWSHTYIYSNISEIKTQLVCLGIVNIKLWGTCGFILYGLQKKISALLFFTLEYLCFTPGSLILLLLISFLRWKTFPFFFRNHFMRFLEITLNILCVYCIFVKCKET